ncbi:hypothetical protein QQZ08_006226 [Neonectria magnoliae]|uniref:Uncharacterized protein n=1 Tax=Neonectria magnoliae TaxID=2732573 RepID=A0ABR1I150_9HYPO
MAANAGVRDGPFVRFPGWDVPQQDQAYLPRLKGNVSELKRTVLDKQGNLFLAFSTNGWIKSWAVLDFGRFVRSPGSDLYVRVEYPGWHFVQGKDSIYNDIEQITDVSTATALREGVVAKFTGDNKIAAFNTDGWIKHRVVYPLVDGPERRSSLSGIYIRTKFLDFAFYSQNDSNGNDIRQSANQINNVPQLIRETEAISNSGGFNTNGWHKHTLQGPPPRAESSFRDPWQGIYYRICWPDFIHLPGLDSPGNDIRNVGSDTQLHALLDEARKDPNAIAVNTNGWLKRALIQTDPVDAPGAENLKGIYIKYMNPQPWEGTTNAVAAASLHAQASDDSILTASFFALKGTVIIWCRWTLKDNTVRAEYSNSVRAATENILSRVRSGEITASAGAAEAHAMRNNYLIGMRNKTSPFGLMIARGIKPQANQYEYYLNKNSNTMFSKPFAELSTEEAMQVSAETIKSAGRANPNVTGLLRKASFVSKGVIVVAAAVSVYSVATAPDWETELGKQVFSWSGAIAAGELGAGVGSVLGPVGAILGGIAGSILGGLGGDALANWFFGGSSTLRGVELLGSVVDEASKLVEAKIATMEGGCYTHVLRAKHSPVLRLGDRVPIEEMIEEVPGKTNLSVASVEGDNAVMATVVWIRVKGQLLPANGKNPRDLVALFDYVRYNLP